MPPTTPVYCARGGVGHLAHYRVEGPTRSEVVCQHHLTASTKWVGFSAKVTPLHHQAPPPEQPALF